MDTQSSASESAPTCIASCIPTPSCQYLPCTMTIPPLIWNLCASWYLSPVLVINSGCVLSFTTVAPPGIHKVISNHSGSKWTEKCIMCLLLWGVLNSVHELYCNRQLHFGILLLSNESEDFCHSQRHKIDVYHSFTVGLSKRDIKKNTIKESKLIY